MFGSEIFWMNPAATSVFEEVNLTSETQEPQQKKGTAAPPQKTTLWTECFFSGGGGRELSETESFFTRKK